MSVYLLGTVDIHDPEGFKPYLAQVPAIVEKYGGRYLVRGGEFDIIEGEWAVRRVTIVEFETMEQAKRWWNSSEYQPFKELRRKVASTNAMFVEGVTR